MATVTHPYNPAELLDTPEARAEYLSLIMADGDPAEISQALGVVARAHGMTAVAKTAA
ncbi:hypothetical protein M0638_28385 [Roseomonas sp. NAR14]|uniref:Addiction module antidote protein n=1 Tax=Roseomonas acroporae TaxID=2937791 RepID=A0A9X1YD88_9PROT|nr:hypothetical protein [Roseomonas acroporae]MCK8788274.1 hypothetical protein [Roseomonas acroporae]